MPPSGRGCRGELGWRRQGLTGPAPYRAQQQLRTGMDRYAATSSFGGGSARQVRVADFGPGAAGLLRLCLQPLAGYRAHVPG